MICLSYSPLRLISGLRPGRDQEACGRKALRLIKIRFTDGQGLEKPRLVVNPKMCDYEIRVPETRSISRPRAHASRSRRQLHPNADHSVVCVCGRATKLRVADCIADRIPAMHVSVTQRTIESKTARMR